ncbi:MAG: ATP-binding protein [Lachnospiraceae bacterium]|nr:ATP-binding protein [Lachnospiraceae bacterium]
MSADGSQEMITEIEREYGRIRLENADLLRRRREEVFEKIPEYKKLLQQTRREDLAGLMQKLTGETSDPGERTGVFSWEEISEKKKSLLEANGFPADYLEQIYTCPDCQDTGYVRDDTGARRVRCHCFKKKLSEKLSEESGLMQLLATENFSNLSMDYYQGEDLTNFQRAYTALREFCTNPKERYKNFFFYGNIGIGKSFLSCCAAKELLDQGREVLYFSSSRLFHKLSSENRSEVFRRRLYECDLLILDDLGTEWFNNFVFSELFTLINERIAHKKPTIISTNLTLKDVADIYSERILSRITSQYMMCKLTGSDIRMEKKRREAENRE